MVAQNTTTRRLGIRELRDHLNEVLREVRDENLIVDVTLHGQVVAELRPKRDTSGPGGLVQPERDLSEDDPRGWTEKLRRRAAAGPHPVDPEERRRINEERDRLAERIAKSWPKGLSAVDAIREDRDAE